jgi:hypothetical protein
MPRSSLLHAAKIARAIGRLMAIIKELQRHRFGHRSERLDADQLALALEDLEQAIAAAEAAAEKNAGASAKPAATRKRQINRGALPPHLPREEIVIDVEDKNRTALAVTQPDAAGSALGTLKAASTLTFRAMPKSRLEASINHLASAHHS